MIMAAIVVSIYRVTDESSPECLSRTVKSANTFFSRFMGLMGRESLIPYDALLIKPCNSIHTGFMKFPIDVIFLDKDNRVTAVRAGLKPWRLFTPGNKSCSVIEFSSGFIQQFQIKPGDQLVIEENGEDK